MTPLPKNSAMLPTMTGVLVSAILMLHIQHGLLCSRLRKGVLELLNKLLETFMMWPDIYTYAIQTESILTGSRLTHAI